MYIHTHTPSDSRCCTAGTNTTLKSKYSPILKKSSFKCQRSLSPPLMLCIDSSRAQPLHSIKPCFHDIGSRGVLWSCGAFAVVGHRSFIFPLSNNCPPSPSHLGKVPLFRGKILIILSPSATKSNPSADAAACTFRTHLQSHHLHRHCCGPHRLLLSLLCCSESSPCSLLPLLLSNSQLCKAASPFPFNCSFRCNF